jgi:hypothetical protein
VTGVATGDLRPGDVVWLVPRTIGAPGITYKQLRGVVTAVGEPYLTVDVAGELHEIHRDNLRRSNPTYDRPRKSRPTAVRTPIAEGEEVPLWH